MSIYIPIGSPAIKIRPYTRDTVEVEKGGKVCIDVYNMNRGNYTVYLYIDNELYDKKTRLGVKPLESVCFDVDVPLGSHSLKAVAEYKGKKYSDTKSLRVVDIRREFKNIKFDLVKYYAEIKPQVYSKPPSTIKVKERIGITLANLPPQIRKEDLKNFKICIEGSGINKCYNVTGRLMKIEWVGEHRLSNNIPITYKVKLYYKDKLMDEETISKTLTEVYNKVLPAIKDIILDVKGITRSRQNIEYNVGVKLAFPPLTDLKEHIILKPSHAENIVYAKTFKIRPKKGKAEYRFTALAESPTPEKAVIGYTAYYESFKDNKVFKRKPVAKTTKQSESNKKEETSKEKREEHKENKSKAKARKETHKKKPAIPVARKWYTYHGKVTIPVLGISAWSSSAPKKNKKKKVALKI